MNRRPKRKLGYLVSAAAGAACLAVAAALAPAPGTASADGLPWMNTSLSPGQRADLLISAMTLDQKIEQLSSTDGPVDGIPACGDGARHVPGIPALDIPVFRITNGPVGVGQGDCTPVDPATALPDSMALAASFDPDLARVYGNLSSTEARTLGLQELEAPGMNLARVDQGGRNFEYLGEDPYLAGTMASSEIRAIQDNGVIAMAKHFVANDQETNRATINVQASDRTLRELYLLPFEMSVKDGGVASVMCAYPSVNGTFNCENKHLLTDVLRTQWGFTGYVQSDWGAMHSTAGSMNAGTDLEFESPYYYAPDAIHAALASGSITVAQIDRALRDRYVQMFRFGDFDRPVTRTPISAQQAAADGATARSIADQSAVLLKNDQRTLPLNAKAIHSIALIGQGTFAGAAVTGGGGSSTAVPLFTVTPLQGLQDALRRLGSSATVHQVIVNDDNSNLADAEAAAAKADVTIVMAGAMTSEGKDRPSLSLPNDQDTLISKVAAANPRTVVVLKDGDPVLMPWLGQVPAVLETWFPGEEDGNVAADLLFGQADPSGKLPVSWPANSSQVPANTPQQYPGVSVNGVPTVTYSEGLDMGYRWYDANHVAPLYPFGYGLSYTNFRISQLTVAREGSDGALDVRFQVQNTGPVAGAETPQVYLGLPASAGEPPERLVAFQKVRLAPGQKTDVRLTIDPAAASHPMSVWDSAAQRWYIPGGPFTVMVGDSSASLPLRQAVTEPGSAG